MTRCGARSQYRRLDDRAERAPAALLVLRHRFRRCRTVVRQLARWSTADHLFLLCRRVRGRTRGAPGRSGYRGACGCRAQCSDQGATGWRATAERPIEAAPERSPANIADDIPIATSAATVSGNSGRKPTAALWNTHMAAQTPPRLNCRMGWTTWHGVAAGATLSTRRPRRARLPRSKDQR